MQATSIKQFPYIRIIACLGIILLHTLFASNVYFENEMTQTDILVTKTIENLLMWAVPCFLMITGALLLNTQKELPNKKIIKYTSRIVIALIAFTFIFQLLDYLMTDDTSLFKQWVYELITGQSWAHMWYLYLMIGLYLMMPFYKIIVDFGTSPQIIGLITIITLFVSIIPLTKLAGIETNFYIPTSIIYPIYPLLGYKLMEYPLKKSKAWMLFGISTTLIIILSIIYYTHETENLQNSFYELFGYQSILVIMQTIGIFSILSQINVKEHTFINTLDKCTFGIYLIHMIFIHWSMKWYGFNPYNHTYFIFIAMAIIFFIAALMITYPLRKIPYINKII